jgi:uncharacterized membrane protein YcaP (DUF421 family)
MPSIDWPTLFQFSVSPFELMLRGSLIYLFLFIIFRFVMRRDAGSFATADILILVIIADASQNGMAGEYKSVSDGFVLIATLIGWNILLDWLAYRFPVMRRIIQSPERLLVRDGQLVQSNMRHEFISVDELMSTLREQGIANLHEVKAAYIERSGQVSVIKQRR